MTTSLGKPNQRSRNRILSVAVAGAMLSPVLLNTASAATKTTKKATAKKPSTVMAKPNGRAPGAAAPFLWDVASTDASLPSVGSFEAATTAIVPHNRLFKLLIIGADARPKENPAKTRGDSIHVFVWNPAFNKGTMIGIPRDAYVQVGKNKDKINSALSSGGPNAVLAAVNSLTGPNLKIDNYVLTGFEGFTNMVNDIGGVNVLVDPAMSDKFSGAMFEKGWFAMNGPAALAFTRNRKSLPGGDFDRSLNQGKFLLNSMQKLREETSDVTGLIKWINSFKKNSLTNLKPSEMLVLAQMARSMNPGEIKNLVLTGKPAKVKVGKTTSDVVMLDPGYVGLFQDVSHDGLNDGK